MASTTPTPMQTSSVVPKHYCTQLQSPLYRLPRELRDQIYEYYLSEEDGYHYDSVVKKFLYQNPSTMPRPLVVRLGLRITCRIANEEMRDVVFPQLNFHGAQSMEDETGYQGLHSRAGRFECLLTYVERQRCRMLVRVAPLLKHGDFLELCTRYPTVKTWFNEPLQRSIANQRDELGGQDILDQNFSDALHRALILAKTQSATEFVDLARITFGAGACPVPYSALGLERHNLFVESALPEILRWQPEPWCIPGDHELSRIEALICQPRDSDVELHIARDSDVELHITKDGARYFRDITAHLSARRQRWYFSAAAVAVDFLRRSSERQRENMRTIVLNEDFKAVSRPESHGRSFIPYCLECPKLRIIRRIGIMNNLLPATSSQPADPQTRFILPSDFLTVLVSWIEEATSLASHGMPAHSFQLVIDGHSEESMVGWNLLIYAAATQEALLRQCRANGKQPRARPAPIDYDCAFTGPWSLPAGFAQMIRDIADGKSTVRYDGDVGELWDPEEFYLRREAWTEIEWEVEWEGQMSRFIPTQGWPSISRKYCHESQD